MSATVAFFVGASVGAIAGVITMALACMASQSEQRAERMHQQPDRRSAPRLTTDPRIEYRQHLAEMRQQWEREHPEDVTGGQTW